MRSESRESAALEVRTATPDNAVHIDALIRALALYEKEPDAVEGDAETIRAQMASERPPFECLLVWRGDQPVGFALFFQTYSTWKAQPGMWLEDFFVLPEHRGCGAGDALFKALLEICDTRGYPRFELTALDWNELAHRFYEKRAMVRMNDWTRWRLSF